MRAIGREVLRVVQPAAIEGFEHLEGGFDPYVLSRVERRQAS